MAMTIVVPLHQMMKKLNTGTICSNRGDTPIKIPVQITTVLYDYILSCCYCFTNVVKILIQKCGVPAIIVCLINRHSHTAFPLSTASFRDDARKRPLGTRLE